MPWRTVEDNIRLALPAHQTDVDLTDLFETLGLGSHLARYPGELSLGLARRAAIARAFAIRPDFLLLDEPFVSLDEAVAARLRNELMALTTRTRVTTLFVTHRSGRSRPIGGSPVFSVRPAGADHSGEGAAAAAGSAQQRCHRVDREEMRALVAQAATGTGQG